MNGFALMLARRWWILGIILALQQLWCAWFIYRSSFQALGRRYFSLFDDAMISMTYARNLVEGYGLNWARYGPPVEGFTHPLWLVPMILANLVPVALPLRSLVIELLSAVLLALDVVVACRLTVRHFAPSLREGWILPAVLVAGYRPLSFWSLVGLESSLQALLCLMAVWLALDITERNEDRHVALSVVLGAACLVRVDMAILAVVVWAYVALNEKPARWQSRWRGILVFVVIALPYAVFRRIYFDDWLPNTYYLKMSRVPLGPRLLRGLFVLPRFLIDAALPLGLAVAGLLAARGRRRVLFLPLAIVVAYCAYSVYVGGDAFEGQARANRFVNFTVPLVFVSVAGALDAFRSRAGTGGLTRLARSLDASVARQIALSVFLVFASNGLLWSQSARKEYFVTEPPVFADRVEKLVHRLARLQELAEPHALVATNRAGIPGYFSDFRLIDILGYNDRRIAHMAPVQEFTALNFREYLPGHVKWDYEEVLRQQPDALFSLWRVSAEEASALIVSKGFVHTDELWLRCGSKLIRWRESGLARTWPECVPADPRFHRAS